MTEEGPFAASPNFHRFMGDGPGVLSLAVIRDREECGLHQRCWCDGSFGVPVILCHRIGWIHCGARRRSATMLDSPPEPTPLDYWTPATRRRTAWELAVLLTPAWCILIVGVGYALGMRDDPFWFASIGLASLMLLWCVLGKRWRLALYCLATGLFVLAAEVLLPTFNR